MKKRIKSRITFEDLTFIAGTKEWTTLSMGTNRIYIMNGNRFVGICDFEIIDNRNYLYIKAVRIYDNDIDEQILFRFLIEELAVDEIYYNVPANRLYEASIIEKIGFVKVEESVNGNYIWKG